MPSPPPCGAHAIPGKPSYQQDRHLVLHTPASSLYLVADGHGDPSTGHLVAEHCVTHLPTLLHNRALLSAPNSPTALSSLQEAIAQLDRDAIAATSQRRVYAGSTLCLLIHSQQHLLVANVGDSRAIVVSRTGVRALTTDHTVADARELARVQRAGGWVVGGLVNGHISMTRAVGDDDLKAHRHLTAFTGADGRAVRGRRFGDSLFTGEADVARTRVREGELASVVASDGVWGRLSNEAVADVVREALRKGRSCQDAARAVVRKAMSKGSRDNVTCVVAVVGDGAGRVADRAAGKEAVRERRFGRMEMRGAERRKVGGKVGGEAKKVGGGREGFVRRERSGLWALRRGLGAK